MLARSVTGCLIYAVAITMALEITAADTIACGDTSVRRCRRPNTRGSWPCSPSEYARREKPEMDVVTDAERIKAPLAPTKKRKMSPYGSPMCERSCVATPTSGACNHFEPRAVCGPGKDERATTAIAT